ncbi:MAG TPA: sulfite exporter TauE/SafE family protein [Candidatus Eisenbacteria bacterium]
MGYPRGADCTARPPRRRCRVLARHRPGRFLRRPAGRILNDVILAGAALLAGAVAAVSGFGIGSLLTPVLLAAYPTAEAVALLSIPHVVASAVRLLPLRKEIDWRAFRDFGMASAGGGLAGALVQSRLASPLMGVILGVLLLMAGCAELFGKRLPPPKSKSGRLIGGLLSGFFGGLVGNQGGIRSAALAGYRLSPRALVATATAAAVLVDLARVPIYLSARPELFVRGLPHLAIATIGVLAGTFLGVPVLGRIPERRYHLVLGLLLVLLGAGLLYRSLT